MAGGVVILLVIGCECGDTWRMEGPPDVAWVAGLDWITSPQHDSHRQVVRWAEAVSS